MSAKKKKIKGLEEIEGRSFNSTFTVDDKGRVFQQQPLYTLTEGNYLRLVSSTSWLQFLAHTCWGVTVTFLLIGVAKFIWTYIKDANPSLDPDIEFLVAAIALIAGLAFRIASKYWQSDRDRVLEEMKNFFDGI
jgi:hypothetical protein